MDTAEQLGAPSADADAVRGLVLRLKEPNPPRQKYPGRWQMPPSSFVLVYVFTEFLSLSMKATLNYQRVSCVFHKTLLSCSRIVQIKY